MPEIINNPDGNTPLDDIFKSVANKIKDNPDNNPKPDDTSPKPSDSNLKPDDTNPKPNTDEPDLEGKSDEEKIIILANHAAEKAKAEGKSLIDIEKARKEAESAAKEKYTTNNNPDNNTNNNNNNDNDNPDDDPFKDMTDLEYTLHHDTRSLGIDLTDDELDIFDKAGLNDLDFSDQNAHGKYIAAMIEVFKGRNEQAFRSNYKPENFKILEFLENGGDLSKYAKVVKDDYSNLEVDESDTESHVNILAKLLVEESNGSIDLERAKRLAKLDVADGDGFNKAKKAADELKRIGGERKQRELTEANAVKQIRAEQLQAKRNDYTNLVNKGRLKIGDQEYNIPEKDRKNLITAKYTTFVQKGSNKMFDHDGRETTDKDKAMSILDVMKFNLKADGEALLDYFIMSGGYKGLAERTATTFKSRFAKRKAVNDSPEGKTPNDTGKTNDQSKHKGFKLPNGNLSGVSVEYK